MTNRTCSAAGCENALSGRRTKFCSTRCSKRENRRMRTNFYERVAASQCMDCGISVSPMVLGADMFRPPTRCELCALARHKQLHAKAYADNHSATRIEFRSCLECQGVFVWPGRDKFCCERHRVTNKSRTARARRRSRLSRVPADRISLHILGCRDGWKCHICGGRVRQRSGNDRLAPSIDHLIPVSADGAHVWDNVALAHKGCNSRRGTGGVAQLLLPMTIATTAA